MGSVKGGRGGRTSSRIDRIPDCQIALEARIAELEKFRIETHNEVTSQGIMLQANVAKKCEFIDVTTVNQMQVEALADEVHTHTQKINEYENRKLTLTQQQNINAILEQINTMSINMNSMKMVITQTFQPS